MRTRVWTAFVAFAFAGSAKATLISTIGGDGSVAPLYGGVTVYAQSVLADDEFFSEFRFLVRKESPSAVGNPTFNILVTEARPDPRQVSPADPAGLLRYSPDPTNILFSSGPITVSGPGGNDNPFDEVAITPLLDVVAGQLLFVVFDAFPYVGAPAAQFGFNTLSDAYLPGEFMYTSVGNAPEGSMSFLDIVPGAWSSLGQRDLQFLANFLDTDGSPGLPPPVTVPEPPTLALLLCGLGLLAARELRTMAWARVTGGAGAACGGGWQVIAKSGPRYQNYQNPGPAPGFFVPGRRGCLLGEPGLTQPEYLTGYVRVIQVGACPRYHIQNPGPAHGVSFTASRIARTR